MTTKKVQTITYQGREYAQVAKRLQLFREENPNGLVEPEPTFLEDGRVMFKVRILKDKSRPESGEAVGHALSDGPLKKNKEFEKLETIATGRALAMLGYAASGEIASSDEMEQFIAYKNEQIADVIDRMNATKTIDELKEVFMGSDLINEPRVVEAKDKRKAELTAEQEPKNEANN